MDLLTTLRAINFNKYNDNGVLSNGLWTLEYRYKMNGIMSDTEFESVQLIVTIKYDGARALTWGCTREDQREAVTHILVAEREADKDKWFEQESKKVLAERALKALNK